MNYEEIREGKVKCLVPSEYKIKVSSELPVFYNPRMRFNRDVTVASLKAYAKLFKKSFTACDAFAGCGIRGIRFAKEVEECRKIILNDIRKQAFDIILKNLELNFGKKPEVNDDKAKLAVEKKEIIVENKDANVLLHENFSKIDAVDVDPFGTPAPFIEASIVALRNDGLLMVTATDVAPLCGVYPKACRRKYDATAYRADFMHELGIRILIGFILRISARYDKVIIPLLSLSKDHYYRVFLLTKRYGAGKVDRWLSNLKYVKHCHCGYFVISEDNKKERCKICKRELLISGPIWTRELHNEKFIKKAGKDVLGKLYEILLGEARPDAPIFYYNIHKRCKKLRITPPGINEIVEEIKSRGYFACRVHFEKEPCIKTNISLKELEMILKTRQK